jgi:DNA-binding CsgD family transcriptional regulator
LGDGQVKLALGLPRCNHGLPGFGARRHLPVVVEAHVRLQRRLCLLGLGLTNADIAERLYLSEGTVRNYVSAVLAKLGVTDRTQAAVLAMRYGLADGSEA